MPTDDLTLLDCVFCATRGPFVGRSYDPRTLPPGVSWPASHCFEGKTIAMCTECGGGFVQELMEDKDISAFYAAIYDARFTAAGPKVEDLNELNSRFFTQALYLKSFINLFDDMRILEVGPNMVGALPALSMFCEPRYCYFDQVESPIISSHGGRYLGPYASGAEIIDKVGEGTLDLVYTSHSLEHVNPSKLEEMLHAISSAIASGGHFFAEVPDDLQADHCFVPHVLFCSERSLSRLLGRHGFEIVHIGRWGGQSSNPTLPWTGTNAGDGVTRSDGLRTGVRNAIRKLLLTTPHLAKAVKPFRLMRGLRHALRAIPTPYNAVPYLRVIARKR